MQYNVVSKETLIDAQKHPEKHKDLIVRVAGYSAFLMFYRKQHRMILLVVQNKAYKRMELVFHPSFRKEINHEDRKNAGT